MISVHPNYCINLYVYEYGFVLIQSRILNTTWEIVRMKDSLPMHPSILL